MLDDDSTMELIFVKKRGISYLLSAEWARFSRNFGMHTPHLRKHFLAREASFAQELPFASYNVEVHAKTNG